jgi:hypothetical protein
VTRLALLLAAGLALSACGNDCLTLAKQVCQCASSGARQQACQSEVGIVNGTMHLTPQDMSRCNSLLKTCDCRLLTTNSLSGKVACGLARPNPNDQSLNPRPE